MTEPGIAGVRRIRIDATVPYGCFGGVEFVRIDGAVSGELDAFERLPGLEHAASNARGRIEYAAPFVLIMPREKSAGNRTLLVDVPNRGRPIAHHLYNSPRAALVVLGTFDPGNGFLQEQGFSVAMLQWELGHGITLPSFVDAHGQTRHVEGAGLVAIRDFADFLRNTERDSAGTPNPLQGRVDRTLAVGYSQTARLLKTMLVEGLDLARGRRVFDALHVHASAAGLANIRLLSSGPESGTSITPRFADPQVRGVTEEPLTYSDIVARAAAHAAQVPRLLVTNMGTDYLSLRASLARTGAAGTADLPIPPNVRIYDVAGASHSRARDADPTCRLPPGRLDFFPVMRATLGHLDAWVRNGSQPPPSRLMPLQPRPGDAQVLQAPAHLPGAVVQTPRLDTDGNALGGVRLPDMEAPLGTHGAQNAPLNESPCNLVAAYLAFARGAAERVAGDDRAALLERYPSHDAYLARIRGATERLVEERFCSTADAAEILRAAQAVRAW